MLKKLMMTIAVSGLVLAGTAWLLGDSFRPLVKVLKNDAKNQLEEIVDRSKLDLAKAEESLVEAKARTAEVRAALATSNAHIQRLEGDIKQAKQQMETSRASLLAIEDRLKENRPVLTVSGRTLSDEEVKIRVQDHGQRIELAEQKIALLEGLLKRHHERRGRLADVDRQAPAELARLELSVKHLAEKVRMYEEYHVRLKEDKAAGIAVEDLFAEAQKTLEAAHEQVDVRLAEFDAKMKLAHEAKPAIAQNDSKETLADIRRILDTVTADNK